MRLFSFPASFILSVVSQEPKSELPLAEAGRYPRLPVARERGLVVGAMELPYWIEREDGEWVLFVEEKSIEKLKSSTPNLV